MYGDVKARATQLEAHLELDVDGNLYVVGAQLPSSLGEKAASASLSVVECTTTNSHSTSAEASHVASAAACRIYSASVTNLDSQDLWLMFFDGTSLPIDGTKSVRTPVLVPANLPGNIPTNGREWSRGSKFTTGCVVALSTTPDSLTVAGAVGLFDVEVQS